MFFRCGIGLLMWYALAHNAVADDAEPCSLAPDSELFLQQAIQTWDAVSTNYLKLDAIPLPRIVVFGIRCQWDLRAERVGEATAQLQLGNRTVQMFSRTHGGEIRLPNESTLPAQGVAYASLYGDEDRKPFFVLALPDVWRLDPNAASHSNLLEILLGVVSHEMVHTRQLMQASRMVNDRVPRSGVRVVSLGSVELVLS